MYQNSLLLAGLVILLVILVSIIVIIGGSAYTRFAQKGKAVFQ